MVFRSDSTNKFNIFLAGMEPTKPLAKKVNNPDRTRLDVTTIGRAEPELAKKHDSVVHLTTVSIARGLGRKCASTHGTPSTSAYGREQSTGDQNALSKSA
jgi:hypothetical protein